MQQTSQQAPQPAQATPPPQASPSTQVGVAMPDGSRLVLPRTADEVRGLRERREILRDQLERAVNRRANLVSQLEGAEGRDIAPEAKAGIQQRLAVLDERIIQIERDQSLTERQLSNAPPDVLAQAAEEARYQYNEGRVPEEEAVAAAFATFGAGIILAMIVGRFRRRKWPKPGKNAAPAVPQDDPRIERLTQTVEAIAEEVERIGEGQRFVTTLLANRQQEAARIGQ